MKYFISLLLLLFSTHSILNAQKKIILDTDPSADPDDVGCMAMLHNMATNGECEILAIINSTHYKQSSLSISAINEFYNRKAIPVGDYKGYKAKIESPKENYDYHLARVYPRSLMSWIDAIDGVSLYREILASADDTSITIVIIGTMHNFYDLLKSEGDQFSSLNGIELVRRKVQQVVTMGGNFIDGKGFDRTNWGGSETLCNYTNWSCLNTERNQMCQYVIEHCPSPFIASGWEVGCGDYYNANYGNVITGQNLRTLDSTHVLRRSYEYHFLTRGETENISRHSNDQCALHYAVRGESNNYTAFTNGKITLSEDGACNWDNSINMFQGYIQKSRDKDSIAREIESLMMMNIQEVNLIPPSQPKNIVLDRKNNKLIWDKSVDKSKGSWVVGYNIYIEDHYFKMVYGNQLLFDDLMTKDTNLVLKAVNSSGIESEASFFTLK
ncbi:hypothetical protein [uncultured Croceitalea sp.]|uniref:hypothetical protein n=1 Tax=uncultured Croceitalea sp. TaxID=1798908 RepID=UPI003306242F